MSNHDIGLTKVQTEALPSSAVARRRMLLKGVAKGTAVLAATVPIQTLAGQSLLTFDGKHQCSISGMYSGVHSATTTNDVCGGYSPGWWGQSKEEEGARDGKGNGKGDGKRVPKRSWPILPNSWTYATPCHDVFTHSYLTNTDYTRPTLFQVMENREGISKFRNTDEFHWICAWLNALSHSFNFPYSGDEVLGFYNQGVASTTYQDALSFFKTYMETHTPTS